MKRRANSFTAVIPVLLLILFAVAGCQQAGVEQVASVDETEPKGTPTTADAAGAETTSPEERDAEAQAEDSGAVADAGGARAGNGKAQAGDAVAGDGKARAGDVVAGDGEARAGDVVAGEGGARVAENSGGSLTGKVILKIGGEPGARFSGTCIVGDEEREVAGRVPGRFVYQPEGREVECEIHNGGPDAGPLEFSVTAGGEDQKRKIKVTGDTVSFTLSEDGISHTTSSASGTAVQKSSISSSSYSNSSVSSSSDSR